VAASPYPAYGLRRGDRQPRDGANIAGFVVVADAMIGQGMI